MTDQYLTRDKTLEVTCVGHASIMMRYGEQIIHVDPYGDFFNRRYCTIPMRNFYLRLFITSLKCFYKFFNCHNLFFFKFINNIFNIITRKTTFKSS